MKLTTQSLEQFNVEAARFARELVPAEAAATVVALSGELGAGKTTFVQAVSRVFGIGEHVTSPTFVIEKIYQCGEGPYKRLIHIDAYRLKEPRELEVLGWDDIAADRDNLILIEWPENVAGLIPADAIWVRLEGADNDRTISYGKES